MSISKQLAEPINLLQQITRNSYRVLGLPSDASWQTVSKRAADLERAAKVGILRPSLWNLEWYGPLQQDQGSIRDALARLTNPEQRLRERFFWITQSEQFLAGLSPANFDDSISALKSSLFPADRHDAAVLALLSCFSTDTDQHDSKRWTTTIQMWVESIASEDFWSAFVEVEEAGQFEPAASFEEFELVRAHSLEAIVSPIGELARDAASEGEFQRCRRALEILRATPLPPEIVSESEESVLGPYEDALVRLATEITKNCWQDIRKTRESAEWNKTPCSSAMDRWMEELAPRYRDFISMAGARSSAALRVQQEYAAFLHSLSNALTWANQWSDAEALLREALCLLSADGAKREQIEALLARARRESEVIAVAEREKERERQKEGELENFARLCKRIESEITRQLLASKPLLDAIKLCEHGLHRYDREVSPWLPLICAADSDAGSRVVRTKTAAAKCLFVIAEAFQYCNNSRRASDVLASAADLAPQGSQIALEIATRRRSTSAESGVQDRARSGQDPARKPPPQPEIESFKRLCIEICPDRSGLAGKPWRDAMDLCESAYERYNDAALPRLSILSAHEAGTSPRVLEAKAAAAGCLLAIAEAFRFCHDCGKASDLMATAADLAPEGSQTAREIRLQRAVLATEIARQPLRDAARDLECRTSVAGRFLQQTNRALVRIGLKTVDGFVHLCDSIMMKYSQQFQNERAGSTNLDGNLLALRAAHEAYKRQVSPWLAAIVESYHGDIPARAGNAAARCLICLAGGFTWVQELETADALALQALPLVADARLEAQVKNRLVNIAAEKRRSVPRPTRGDHKPATGRSGAPGRRTAPSRSANTGSLRSEGIENSRIDRNRLRNPAAILLGGMAVVIAIPIVIDIVNRPAWQPCVGCRNVSQRTYPVGSEVLGQHQAGKQPVPHDQSVERFMAGQRAGSQNAVSTDQQSRGSGWAVVPETRASRLGLVPVVSLLNGTELIAPPAGQWIGELKISNNGGDDALVKLKTAIDPRKSVRSVYLRARNEVTLDRIQPQEYIVQFVTGQDFDADNGTFRANAAFSQFETTLSYTEDAIDERSTQLSIQKITLRADPSGKVNVKTITGAEFAEGLAGTTRKIR
jgi:hypothetical protein